MDFLEFRDVLPVAFNAVFYCSYSCCYFSCSYSRFSFYGQLL